MSRQLIGAWPRNRSVTASAAAHVAVAKDLELPVVVRRDHRLAEKADGMLAKVGRDIAHRAAAARDRDRSRAPAAAAVSGSACRSAQARCSANTASRVVDAS